MIVKLKDHLWLQKEMLEKAQQAAGKVVGSFFYASATMEKDVRAAVRSAVAEALRAYDPDIPWLQRDGMPMLLGSYVDVVFAPDTSFESFGALQKCFWPSTQPPPPEGKFVLHFDRLDVALSKSGLVVKADDPRAVAEIIGGANDGH